jgi:hypothetical protein
MWRLYDGLSEVSQQTIGDWMGGTSCGVSQQAIADAVNHFTATTDAYRDVDGYNRDRPFMSRQITSIDNATPAIAILDGFHAVVVNGGRWQPLDDGQYQWNYTYVHDPDFGPDRYFVAADWVAMNCPYGSTCDQIVSAAASGAWSSNLNAYGGSTVVRGDIGILNRDL